MVSSLSMISLYLNVKVSSGLALIAMVMPSACSALYYPMLLSSLRKNKHFEFGNLSKTYVMGVFEEL